MQLPRNNPPRASLLLATLALIAPRDASAIFGDRFGDFGLDGSFRTIVAATQNYDEPLLFGPDNEADALAQNILRLVTGGRPNGWLSYEVHGVQYLTLEAKSGALPTTGAGVGGSLLPSQGVDLPYRLVPLQLRFGERASEDVHARLVLDRLNVKLVFALADITIGRQAITFGKAYFWNPLDVFLAFGSTQFDREYKEGVDALRVDVPFGSFSGVTLVAAASDVDAQDQWQGAAALGRIYTTLSGWDFVVQSGKILGGYQLGAGLVGELSTIEVRGEGAYFWPLNEDDPLGSHTTFVLGLGRRFENTLHLQAEYLYNGGAPNNLLEAFDLVGTGRLLQASPHVAGLLATYEIIPILNGSLAYLVSIDDGSMLFQPGLTYSAANEVDVLAGAVVVIGERPEPPRLESEFGTYPNFFYTEVKVYF